MGKSSHENAPQASQCGASSHEQSDSDESPEDLQNLQNGSFKGIFSTVQGDGTTVLADGRQMKLMKRKFGQWWNSNIYQKFLPQSSTWQFFIIQWPNPTEMF